MSDWLFEHLPDNNLDVETGELRVDPDFHYRDFQQGRAFPEAFEVFMEKFGHVLEKRQGWVARVLEATEDKDLLTVSSEAFGLLVLENNWNRWIDQYIIMKKSGGKQIRSKLRDLKSQVVPLYTKGGVLIEDKEKSEGYGIKKGWTAEGINRFNYLYWSVVDDRRKNPGVFKNWQKMYSKRLQSTASSAVLPGGTKLLSNDGGGVFMLDDEEANFAKDERNKKKARDNNKRLKAERKNKEPESETVVGGDQENNEEESNDKEEMNEMHATDETGTVHESELKPPAVPNQSKKRIRIAASPPDSPGTRTRSKKTRRGGKRTKYSK